MTTPIEPEKTPKTRDISLILRDLLKVIKVVSLYPESNPLPQSMKQSFSEKLVWLTEEHGDIVLEIQKDCIMLGSDVIYTDRSKEENLSDLLFSTGITDLTFQTGLTFEEVYKLLDILKQYVNSRDKSLDLANLFWEAGISSIKIKTLDDVALANYDEKFDIQEYIRESKEDRRHRQAVFGTDADEAYQGIFNPLEDESSPSGGEGDDNTGQTGPSRTGQTGGQRVSAGSPSRVGRDSGTIFYAVLPDSENDSFVGVESVDEVSFKAFEAAKAMGFDDVPARGPSLPDTALVLNDEFKLSEEEEEMIRGLLVEDALFDPYESTVEILKEMLLQEDDMTAFYETVTITEKVMSEFIQQSHLAETARVLHYLKDLQTRLRKKRPLWAERLKEAVVMAASRDRLKVLGDVLNDNAEVSAAELRIFLDHFGWEAMNGLTDLMSELKHNDHRECLSEWLTRSGSKNIDLMAKGIFDKRPEVVINTIVVLARIHDDRAFVYLQKALSSKEESVRLALMENLKGLTEPTALEILKQAARDESPSVRTEAVNAIVAHRGKAAFDAITDIISENEFAQLNQTDKQSLLTAYSILGGDQAVNYLVRLIKTYNFSRSAVLSFLRTAAFEALSRNRSEKAERTLLELSRSWRPNIKLEAQEAIRRRREIIYGGQ